MYPSLPVARLLLSMNDIDIPLSPPRDWMNVFNDCCSLGLAGLVALPQVLQDSVLDWNAGMLINLFLLALASFGNYSILMAVIIFVILGLALIYYVIDGDSYVRIVWQKLQPKERVYPSDLLYQEEAEEVRSHQSHESSQDEVVDFNADLAMPSEEPHHLRSGLFEQTEQFMLVEGPLRTVKSRVTRPIAIQDLDHMNRKFNVVTPVDSVVLEFEGITTLLDSASASDPILYLTDKPTSPTVNVRSYSLQVVPMPMLALSAAEDEYENSPQKAVSRNSTEKAKPGAAAASSMKFSAALSGSSMKQQVFGLVDQVVASTSRKVNKADDMEEVDRAKPRPVQSNNISMPSVQFSSSLSGSSMKQQVFGLVDQVVASASRKLNKADDTEEVSHVKSAPTHKINNATPSVKFPASLSGSSMKQQVFDLVDQVVASTSRKVDKNEDVELGSSAPAPRPVNNNVISQGQMRERTNRDEERKQDDSPNPVGHGSAQGVTQAKASASASFLKGRLWFADSDSEPDT
eukprot:gene26782-30265_t